MAIDIDDSRLTLARDQYGADLVANSAHEGAAQQLLSATGGLAAIVDFVGSAPTADLAFSVLAPGGTYVNVGLFGGELRLPLAVLSLRQWTVRGSYVGSLPELKQLIDHVRAGRIRPIPVSIRAFDTVNVNEGLAALRDGKVHGRQVLIHEAA